MPELELLQFGKVPRAIRLPTFCTREVDPVDVQPLQMECARPESLSDKVCRQDLEREARQGVSSKSSTEICLVAQADEFKVEEGDVVDEG